MSYRAPRSFIWPAERPSVFQKDYLRVGVAVGRAWRAYKVVDLRTYSRGNT